MEDRNSFVKFLFCARKHFLESLSSSCWLQLTIEGNPRSSDFHDWDMFWLRFIPLCVKVTTRGLDMLELRELSLSCNLLEIPAVIWHLSLLENLSLSGNLLTKIPPEIELLTRLKDLDLSDNQLYQLPSELVNLTNLECLNLMCNQLVSLPFGMSSLVRLKALDLAGNMLGNAVSTLCPLFDRKDVSISSIFLAGNCLKSDGVKILCEVLLSVSSITLLDLSANAVQDEGCCYIGQVSQRCSLRSLELSWNGIGERGVGLLCEGLQKSASLTRLCLSDNPIEDSGAQMLVGVLRANKQLKHLVLSGCMISSFGASLLFDVCHHNVSTIDLSRNAIGRDALISLDKMMNRTVSLRKLDMCNNNMSENDEEAIVDSLVENGSIVGGRVVHLSSKCIKLASDIIKRNEVIHETVRVAAEFVLAIHKFRRRNVIGKDCGVVLARCLFETRIDVLAWEKHNKHKRCRF